LSAGLATGATVTNRSMTVERCCWGMGCIRTPDTRLNFATTSSLTGSGAAQPITIYGQIPAAEYVTPGAYTDTITVTVSY